MNPEEGDKAEALFGLLIALISKFWDRPLLIIDDWS